MAPLTQNHGQYGRMGPRGHNHSPKRFEPRRGAGKGPMMARPRSGVSPCSKCRYPTRTSRASLAEFPGTRQRVREMCRRCAEEETPRPYREQKPPTVREQRALAQIQTDPPDPAIVSGLNAFVAARNARLARLERMYR